MKIPEQDYEISQSIKNTLSNYDAGYIEGAWEHFIERKKKKHRIVLWSWGAGIAASLLLTWFNLQPFVSPNTPLQKQLHSEVYENKTIIASSVKPGNDSIVEHKNGKTPTSNLFPSYHLSDKATISSVPDENAIISDSTVMVNNSIDLDSANTGRKTLTLQDSSSIASFAKKIPIQKEPVFDNTPLLSIDEGTGEIGKTKATQSVEIGFGISPMYSSTSSDVSFSFAAGVNADISISRQLMLSTGLILEKQDLDYGYENQILSTSSEKFNASLLSLDIPINLVIQISAQKNHTFYVSGGMSSLAYLGERYETTTYTTRMVEVLETTEGVQTVSYKMVVDASTEKQSVGSFKKIDLFGRANIMAGMKYKISPKLFLHIEPFLKIPVTGLGSYKVKYNVAGVGCKISF